MTGQPTKFFPQITKGRDIFLLIAVFLFAVPSPIFAGLHRMSTSFDITLDAANELLATTYYSETAVLSAGRRDVCGDFKVDLIMHQPTSDNIDIYMGNLYVDLEMYVSGKYTIGGQPKPVNRWVRIRLGLKDEGGLRFAAGQIHFLDKNLPPPLKGIIRRYIDKKLIQLKDSLVTTASLINALPTTPLTLENNTVAYTLWYGKPELRIKKRSSGNVLLMSLPLHAHLRATFPDFGELEKQYKKVLETKATVEFNANSENVLAKVEIVPDSILIPGLPGWLETLLTSVLRKEFVIYNGRPYDALPGRIPDDIDIKVDDIYDGPTKILDDRLRLVVNILSDSHPPQIRFYIKRSQATVDIKIESNIRAEIMYIAVTVGSRSYKQYPRIIEGCEEPIPLKRIPYCFALRDPGIIEKSGYYITTWDRDTIEYDIRGMPISPEMTHLIFVLFETGHNFFIEEERRFSGAGPDADWQLLE